MMFHEGQEVLLIETYSRAPQIQRVKVEKVGRKYATIRIYGREYRFDRESGYAASENQRQRIMTQEQFDTSEENSRKIKFLAKYGIHNFDLHKVSEEDFLGLYDYLKERGYE
jgi:hypothetical protein